MKTVMLIDDSEADLLFSRIVVSRSGLCDEVLAFDSAAAALDHLRSIDRAVVDMILLDINMPGMDGFQFLDAFEALADDVRAGTVVVMLTSSPDQRDRMHAQAYSCVRGYVVKPISLAAARQLMGLLPAMPNDLE
jgi:CheY-like chemotaxis protein